MVTRILSSILFCVFLSFYIVMKSFYYKSSLNQFLSLNSNDQILSDWLMLVRAIIFCMVKADSCKFSGSCQLSVIS